MLKTVPEAIRDRLARMYRAQDKPWPPRAYPGGLDENTALLPDDRRMLVAEILRHELTDFAAKDVGAIYSSRARTMLIKSSSVEAGTLAHEMAPGCADTGWHEMIVMTVGLGMCGMRTS